MDASREAVGLKQKHHSVFHEASVRLLLSEQQQQQQVTTVIKIALEDVHCGWHKQELKKKKKN